jgi:hypothetical protein
MATPESKRLVPADFQKAALLLSVPVAAERLSGSRREQAVWIQGMTDKFKKGG